MFLVYPVVPAPRIEQRPEQTARIVVREDNPTAGYVGRHRRPSRWRKAAH
jgi:hypothetical protein